MLSTLSSAISDCREIAVELPATGEAPPVRRRLRPVTLIVDPPQIRLAAWEVGRSGAASSTAPPVLINLDDIAKVKTLDTTLTPLAWVPQAVDLA